ncbi:MAG: tail fiber domain-containing protein [Parcubacteria group bacterium]
MFLTKTHKKTAKRTFVSAGSIFAFSLSFFYFLLLTMLNGAQFNMVNFPIALAAPDQELTYHGKLTDTLGLAVSNGDYDFTLTIYDQATGGTCLWTARGTCGTPASKSLTVTNGIFITTLGESGDNPLDISFDANYYLEVQIGTNSPMSPRRKITPTGFALNAHRLNGLTAENYIDTSATAQTKEGDLTLNGDLAVDGILYDSSGDAGNNGQILSTTASGTNWIDAPSGGGSSTFLGLTDTPSSYTANQFVRVNAAGTALEFVSPPTDTLANLSCASNQVPQWNGSAWVCATISGVGGTVYLSYGTAALPSLTFTSDPNTGIFHSGSVNDNFSLTAAGISQMTIGAGGVTIPTLTATTANITTNNTTTTTLGAGSVSAPALAFTGYSADTGLYSVGTDSMGFAAAGINQMTVNTSGVTIPTLTATTANITTNNTTTTTLGAGSVSAPALAFTGYSADTGLYSVGTDSMGFAAAGINQMTVNTSGVTIPTLTATTATITTNNSTTAVMGNGTVALPSMTFTGDTDTGLYHSIVNTIGFSAAGTNQMTVNTSGVTIPTLSVTTNLSLTNPFANTQGSVTAPSYTFNGFAGTGMYLPVANAIGFSANGVNQMTVNTSGVTIPTLSVTSSLNLTNPLVNTQGSVAAPSYTFTGYTGTGLYLAGANALGFSAAGTNRMTVNASGVTIPTLTATTANITTANSTTNVAGQGNVSAPSYTFTSYLGTGMYLPAANAIGFSAAGTNQMTVNTSGVSIPALSVTTSLSLTNPLVMMQGSAAVPSYTFSAYTGTGLYLAGANAIGFSAAGTNQMTVNISGVTIPTLTATTANITTLNPTIVYGALGSAAAPTYTFNNDGSNTGIYRSWVDQIGFSADGTNQMTVGTSGVGITTLTATTANVTNLNPTIVYGALGSASAPTYTFNNDGSNTGIYRSWVDQMGFVADGVSQMTIGTTGVTIPTLTATTATITNFAPSSVKTGNGSAAAPAYTFSGDTATGMYYTPVNNLGFAAAGVNQMTVNTSGVTIPTLNATTANVTNLNPTIIYGSLGSVSAPTYTFNNDGSNTGIYRSFVDTIGFSADGTNQMTVGPSGVGITTLNATTANITTLNPTIVYGALGSAAAPTYTFNNDGSNTGIYRSWVDQMGFVADGVSQMTIGTTGVTVYNTLYPGTDATYNLGSGSYRWNTVYAANGTINTSDITLKENINDLSYGLDEVLAITPISFNWKDSALGTQKKIGFSAQELQNIIPEVVKKADNGTLGVYYSDLIPVAFNAIKEQNALIKTNTNDLTTKATATSLSELQQITNAQYGEVKSDFDDLQGDVEANTTDIAIIKTNMDAMQTGLDILTLIGATDYVTIEKLLTIDPDKIIFANKEGDVTIAGVLTTDKIITKELTTQRIIVDDNVTEKNDDTKANAASVGTATIASGEKEVVVETTALSKDSRVFVTANSKMEGNTYYVEKNYDKGRFTITIDHISDDGDVKFDWFIVGTEDAN